jgi:uncharacterized protein (DUF849 family)
MQPLVIEAALNGATSKARNPHVPVTPEEIARTGVACVRAGAAIVHTHIDDYGLDGDAAAARYRAGWAPILAAHPDVLLYPTVAVTGRAEQRFAHVEALARAGAARMGVLDPGSVNLGGTTPDGLPGGIDIVYANSYGDVRWVVEQLSRLRLAPSVSIFEPGFLRTALAYHRAGRLPAGALVKLYFGGDHPYLGGPAGATFGLPPTPTALAAYLELLEGTDLPWSVAVIGGDVVGCGLARAAMKLGGHVRVGLEDYAGPRTPTNEELIAEVVAEARVLGRPVASPADAARVLGIAS